MGKKWNWFKGAVKDVGNFAVVEPVRTAHRVAVEAARHPNRGAHADYPPQGVPVVMLYPGPPMQHPRMPAGRVIMMPAQATYPTMPAAGQPGPTQVSHRPRSEGPGQMSVNELNDRISGLKRAAYEADDDRYDLQSGGLFSGPKGHYQDEKAGKGEKEYYNPDFDKMPEEVQKRFNQLVAAQGPVLAARINGHMLASGDPSAPGAKAAAGEAAGRSAAQSSAAVDEQVAVRREAVEQQEREQAARQAVHVHAEKVQREVYEAKGYTLLAVGPHKGEYYKKLEDGSAQMDEGGNVIYSKMGKGNLPKDVAEEYERRVANDPVIQQNRKLEAAREEREHEIRVQAFGASKFAVLDDGKTSTATNSKGESFDVDGKMPPEVQKKVVELRQRDRLESAHAAVHKEEGALSGDPHKVAGMTAAAGANEPMAAMFQKLMDLIREFLAGPAAPGAAAPAAAAPAATATATEPAKADPAKTKKAAQATAAAP